MHLQKRADPNGGSDSSMDPDQAIPTLALWVTIPALDPDPQKSGIAKPLTYTHQIVDQRWGRAFSGCHPCST